MLKAIAIHNKFFINSLISIAHKELNKMITKSNDSQKKGRHFNSLMLIKSNGSKAIADKQYNEKYELEIFKM